MWPARTYIHQFCVETRCSLEDLSWSRDNRDGCWETDRQADKERYWEYIYIYLCVCVYIYIYIYMYVCMYVCIYIPSLSTSLYFAICPIPSITLGRSARLHSVSTLVRSCFKIYPLNIVLFHILYLVPSGVFHFYSYIYSSEHKDQKDVKKKSKCEKSFLF